MKGDPELFTETHYVVNWPGVALVAGLAAVVWFGFWTARVSRRWGERKRDD